MLHENDIPGPSFGFLDRVMGNVQLNDYLRG